jgi:glycosyltransferase involved in cell wall biosynthesis
VLLQAFGDWECVIVDDGSRDGTKAIAEKYAYKDSRFHVISQENMGTGGAYNTGVSAAVGQWVTICSADDVLLPGHLSTMAEAAADHPSVDIFTCNGYFWWPDGSKTIVYTEQADQVPRSWTLEDLFERCFFSVGACYRRELFGRVGGYKDAYGEDYDFWLRAMAAGACHYYLPSALALHRRTTT